MRLCLVPFILLDAFFPARKIKRPGFQAHQQRGFAGAFTDQPSRSLLALLLNSSMALLPKGRSAWARKIDRDWYGRTVAELFSGEQPVNLQLVHEGVAVVYPQYLNGCAATKDQYLNAEAAAKQKGFGVWNPQNRMPVRPWEYRKQRHRQSIKCIHKLKAALLVERLN